MVSKVVKALSGMGMSTYFSGADAGTYPGYYGPGGSVTVGASAELLGVTYGISMAGVGTVDNFGTVESGWIAVYLGDGGTVTNGSTSDMTSLIYGAAGIFAVGADAVVHNFGSIDGDFLGGIALGAGGYVVNGAADDYTACITSNFYGIGFVNDTSIKNLGSIESNYNSEPGSYYGIGIDGFYGSLYLINGSENDAALIYGARTGIDASDATIRNYGEINSLQWAIHSFNELSVNNEGDIEGGTGIYCSFGFMTIYNSGTIAGISGSFFGSERGISCGHIGITYTGFSYNPTAFINNDKDSLIEGVTIGIYAGDFLIETVINYGTIQIGDTYLSGAIDFNNSHDLLVIEGGSKIFGGVSGGGGTLELGAAGGPGTVLGLGAGSHYSDFSTYVVQANAEWTLAGYDTIHGDVALGDDSNLTVSGTLDIAGTLTGDGTIDLSDHATLDVFGLATGGVVNFAESTGTLSLADPLGVNLKIDGFGQGDVIDLPGVSDTGTASLSYGGGVLSVLENGTLAAELSLTNVPTGTVFGLQGDHHGGTEVVIWSVPNVLPAAQLGTLENGIIALGRDVAATQSVTDPSLNVFTPKSLLNPSGGPVKGDINIADGRPTAIGETITLGPKAQGIVLTGQHRAAEIVGHAANAYAATELLVGNNGNDTILGGGGSGTIIAGSGQNQIETGSGNMLVSSSGTDQIETGSGDDTVYAGGVAWVTAQGNATVHAGGGFTTFTDAGTATSADKVKGGSGTTIMNSGIGQDTFVGGTGTSFMNDTGPGHMTLVFNRGTGGTDIVTGFDPSNGDYIRATATSNGWADFQNNISVIGGSSFVNLADGTKIEFVGFTSLSAADFHG